MSKTRRFSRFSCEMFAFRASGFVKRGKGDTHMRMIGVDPGLRNMGWGVIERREGGRLIHVASGSVHTKSGDLAPRLSPSGGPFDVQLVRFDPHRTVKITRGENAGRTLDYANIVLGWHGLGTWDGVAAVTLSADLPDDMPVAVLVQRRDTGAIAVAGRSD